MKKFKYSFQLLICLVAASAGCSEKEEPTPLTYSQLLSGTTSKTWRFSGFEIIEADQVPANFDPSQVVPACAEDDLYVFYADKDRKFEIQEGATKCNSDNPDVLFTDTWSIVNATASINFVFRIFPIGSFTLKSITERTLIVEYYVKEYNFSYRFIFTSQRQ